MGLEVVKFFPAEPSGGLDMIKAVAAPYTTLRFMPTGGINPENIVPYLQYDKILACGGSWMVKGKLSQKAGLTKLRSWMVKGNLVARGDLIRLQN